MGTSYTILIHARAETIHGPSKAIQFLNDQRLELQHYGLFEITEPAGLLGYTEAHGTGCFSASAKNLRVEMFKEAVRSAQWYWPEQVVVIISEDAGDTIDIFRPT